MILTWGKFIHEQTVSEGGVPKKTSQWVSLPTPKEGSLKVEEQEGEEVVAKEEGGAIVDTRRGEPNVTVSFQLFVKGNETLPFGGKKGQIPGEIAYRLRGLEDSVKGILIERASVYARVEMSSADGILMNYTIKGLAPKEGDILKLKPSSELKGTTA